MPVIIHTVPWTYLGRGQLSPGEDILAMRSRGLDNYSQGFCLAVTSVNQRNWPTNRVSEGLAVLLRWILFWRECVFNLPGPQFGCPYNFKASTVPFNAIWSLRRGHPQAITWWIQKWWRNVHYKQSRQTCKNSSRQWSLIVSVRW